MASYTEHGNRPHGAPDDDDDDARRGTDGAHDDGNAQAPHGAHGPHDDPGAHDEPDDDVRRIIHADARRKIIRRATLFSVGFLATGLVIALAGAALVAWLFSRGRLPFFETWLVVTAIIVLPGMVAAAWKLIRDR